MNIAKTNSDANSHVRYPLSKSIADKSIALTCLIVLSPLFAIILIAMGLNMLFRPEDRGKWLFRDRRISNGKEFDILKFRILRQGFYSTPPPDDLPFSIYEKESENLTWVGRYLIKPWYLDELPQLLNILKGDMSLVGPRPWPVSMVNQQLEEGYDYRNRIRGGWTGLNQLRKSEHVLGDPFLVEADLEYLDHCANYPWWRLLLFDLRVVYKTIFVMFESKGLKN
ncbi:MAG: sugar transferase [Pyrinomonadaceae bacterium]